MTRFILSQQNADGSTSLYSTDGTAAGTTSLDMSRFNFVGGSNFIEFSGKTEFLGQGGTPTPYTYVYATDGTAAGTTGTLVHAEGGPLIPRGLWVVGDKLLASGESLVSPAALYASSDGVTFTEIESGVGTDNLTVAHGIGYFAADLNQSGTNALWRTDGTAAGTYSITPKGATLNPTDIASVGNGRAVFVNKNADGSTTLWATNGTAAGTYALGSTALGHDIRPQFGIATANSHAIFTAVGADNNISVWSSDGTSAGTYELLVNGPADAPVREPGGYVTWGSKVLFSTGYGVAVTDGTRAGTVKLSSGEPIFFAGVGNRVFIASNGAGATPALFTSDGTANGTMPLAIKGLATASGDYTVVNGQVVFAGVDTSGKEALFSSDGTTAGSHELSLPSGITINPNDLPVIGALPDAAAPMQLTGVLPSPLYTGTETVTGTGGVAGLQLERITQGSHNAPGQSGWVKATVASDGSWSVQLTFDKPGMLAHVFAANGGSSTVVDLVDGTPVARTSAVAPLSSLADGVQRSIASDMSAMAARGPASAAVTLHETSHSGSALSLADLHAAALVVPDHLAPLHHGS